MMTSLSAIIPMTQSVTQRTKQYMILSRYEIVSDLGQVWVGVLRVC